MRPVARFILLASLAALPLPTVAGARPVDPERFLPRLEVEESAPSDPGRGGVPLSNNVWQDTIAFGGTYWAADSLRWEAIRDSCWTFDTGVGSSLNTGFNPNKPIGYHQTMEGWLGLDQSLDSRMYFRRSSTCAIAGSFSLWAGLSLVEANARCYASGQGYGNRWSMSVAKSFHYPGSGNTTLSWRFAVEAEPGFDYAYVWIDTTGTGAAEDVLVSAYDGTTSGLGVSMLVPGTRMRSTAGPITIRLAIESDGGYSDEDGAYPTTCGIATFDNIQLTGAITDFADFETGMDGWVALMPVTAVGDFSHLEDVAELPPTSQFCPCNLIDSVMVFTDAAGGHPIDQDNVAMSPWIDLRRHGVVGRPGKLLVYDLFQVLPIEQYVFLQTLSRYYPEVCAATGGLIVSPFRSPTVLFPFSVACSPVGIPRLRDISDLVKPGAEQVQVAVGLVNLCRTSPFGDPCTGITNTTPWFDNVFVGVYGNAARPSVNTTTFDRFQDNFAADGSLNPASPGRLDQNRIKGASTPSTGTSLGDTLTARGNGGNVEVRLVFKVRPGPFVNPITLAAYSARWTFEPGLNGRYGTDANPATWPNWYSARMDSAEQGGNKDFFFGIWMSTFHESDPGFMGTDTALDPNDPGRLANDLLPDHLFTPGSRIDYFIASRYLPPDPRNPGGDQWSTDPDTARAGFREVEILPSSMAADTSWNCVLYVDHHDDRNQDDQYIEELGLKAALGSGGANAEGTRYDRFDNQTPSSAQMSFGRPLQSKYGCSQTQVFAYQAIAWHGATLTSGVLTVEDAAILDPWLKLSIGPPRRFWGSGEGIMQSMQVSGGLARSFMNNTLGVQQLCTGIRLAGCPSGTIIDTTYCLPTAPATGAHFASSILPRARGNGCPSLLAFDLLQANPSVPSARGQLDYVKLGAPRPSASVTNESTGPSAYRTVLDGISVGRLRTNDGYFFQGCDDIGASLARTADILTWFGAMSLCEAPANLSAVQDDRPPPAPVVLAVLGVARPNPMLDATVIALTQGAAAGPVRLEIFDVTGRLVRRLADGPLEPGPHEFTWDGRAADGRAVADGMYFYRMTAGERVEARKLMVVGAGR